MAIRKRYPVIAGPTASGKSALAIALAQRLNGEVISADSMQIYAEVSIGTARPTAEEMQGVSHHLLGFLPLSAPYSVAQYVADAKAAIADIEAAGRLPILCGGTGLYLQALTENLFFEPMAQASPALREQLRARFDAQGGAALLSQLRAVDPDTAARLHENDAGRIIRALEVYMTTGRPMSAQIAASRRAPADFDTCLIVLDFRDRQKLYDRIHERVERMLQNGLLEEARTVLARNDAPTALQAIGYKELRPFFDGEIPLSEALSRLKQSTRRYAKRQLSWFRRMPDTHYLYVDEYATTAALTAAALAVWEQDACRKGETT